MRAIKLILKLILFIVWVTLALAWMIFFGAFGAACLASVVFAPVGIASFGLAVMPLFAALTFMGWRHQSQQVTVNVLH
jgi:hypothetical protein